LKHIGWGAGLLYDQMCLPSHFAIELDTGETLTKRIWAVRANASFKIHAELCWAEELDDGDTGGNVGLSRCIPLLVDRLIHQGAPIAP